MFLENSRYAKTPTTTVTDSSGQDITVLKRRQLGSPVRGPYTVLNHDRLDLIAHERYGDSTKFWHIADANTELEAPKLTEQATGVINLPTT